MDYLVALASDPGAWAALATLLVMEVVLGIDNLIFISILTNKLPEAHRARTQRLGIGLALVMRLGLLGTVALIVRLTAPIFTAFGHDFSWRDLILIAGGAFLVWKATTEIHHHVSGEGGNDGGAVKTSTLTPWSAIGQILVLDLVFSIDSIVTAVGMTDHFPIMAIAVVIVIILMGVAAGPLSSFISSNPTLVMLALSFLMMIGMVLVADGFGLHVPKGYIYAAFLFSGAVEALNTLRRVRRRRKT